MEKELVVKKAGRWINSGKLPHRPDPLTGEDDDESREHGVPREWQRLNESDMLALRFDTHCGSRSR